MIGENIFKSVDRAAGLVESHFVLSPGFPFLLENENQVWADSSSFSNIHYESFTPTSLELSSSIFHSLQVCFVLGIDDNWLDLHFFHI